MSQLSAAPSSTPSPFARREFLGQLGIAATALAGSGAFNTLVAEEAERSSSGKAVTGSPWDMSWVDKIAVAKYRVVFDAATALSDNLGADYAWGFLEQFHEVYDTRDADVRAVIVFRQMGTSLGLSDSIWERYPVGEHTKMDDPTTKLPYRRNPAWLPRPGASAESAATKLATLTARGVIVLVCNIAAGNVAAALARATNKPVEEVQADVRKNLVPGALLVPSGVFALIRAQNAGCAFLRA